ncbi:unnamed protein product [Absidia cylindrospora]
MRHAATDDTFTECVSSFKNSYEHSFAYFESTWYNRKQLWSKAYRRIMIADYRQDAVSVFYGFKSLTLSKIERIAKDKADNIDIDLAYSMGTEVTDNVFSCKSFTCEGVDYVVSVSPSGSVSSCSCPFVAGICKHMFILSRVKLLPYSSRVSFGSPSAASSSTPTTTTIADTNVIEMDNKITNLQKGIAKSIDSARKRVYRDEDEMDKLCDTLKAFLNVVDTVDDRPLYSSRQT